MSVNVTHRQLTMFVYLADCRSFADAAAQLHLSQPALSIALKKFEEAVGGNLLARSTRAVELTPEGQAFLPVARRLLNDWDAAFADLHNLFAMQRGKLTIAAMPSFANSLLPDLLQAFHQQYANINIAIMDVVMELAIDAVRQERAELGFVFEARQMDGVHFVPLFDDRFMLVTDATHPLAGQSSVTWPALQNMDFVAMNRGSSIRDWCDDSLARSHTRVNVVAEANQLATVGQLVRSGLGLSIVPALCRPQMEDKGLCCIGLDVADNHRAVGIVHRQRGRLSAPAQRLLTLATERNW